MQKKFLIKKYFVIPVLVAMFTLPSVTQALANDDTALIMNSQDSIVITEYADSTTSTTTDQALASQGVALSETPMAKAPLYAQSQSVNRPNNFPEMSKALEELTGTVARGSELYGPLYNGFGAGEAWVTGDSAKFREVHISADNAFLKGVLQNPAMLKWFNDNQSQLKQLATKTFSDIPSDGSYYGQYLILPVYYGTITGYEENGQKLFKPQNTITAQEVAVMLARAYNTKKTIEEAGTMGEAKDVRAKGIAEWAAPSWGQLSTAMPLYQILTGDQSARFQAPMNRAQVAYAIAKTLFPKDVEKGSEYYQRAADASNSPFSDINKVLLNSDQLAKARESGSPLDAYRALLDDATANPQNGIPQEYLAAMLSLNDKGIMRGDDNGNSMWSQGIKRCDMLIMLHKSIEAVSQRLDY